MSSLEVLDVGALVTVQDAGRPGHAHLGVPRAGWLDGPAARLALRLVGDPEDRALLEVAVGGVAVRPDRACWVAVTGAPCAVDLGGRAGAHGRAERVPAGAVLRLGPATSGVRSYLAVAGGIDVEPVLGSRSTDTLAWVGPPRVEAGDRLPVGEPAGPPRPADVPDAAAAARPGRTVVLRVHPGPRLDRLSDDALDVLCSAAWTVGADADRVGLRLDGPALRHARTEELPSEGLVLGAVQVPPDGRPVVFLADHPTTGGYPVAAVVDAADLAACAQLRPGDPVSFRRARGA